MAKIFWVEDQPGGAGDAHPTKPGNLIAGSTTQPLFADSAWITQFAAGIGYHECRIKGTN